MGTVTNYCNAYVVLVMFPSLLSSSCDVYTARKKEHKRLLTAMQLTNAFFNFLFLLQFAKLETFPYVWCFSLSFHRDVDEGGLCNEHFSSVSKRCGLIILLFSYPFELGNFLYSMSPVN